VSPRIPSRRKRSPAHQLSRYRQANPQIPRVFHQIWLGGESLPEEFHSYRESWRREHPGWELQLWTEENLPEGLRSPVVYDRTRRPVERADVLRLELLWRFGGVYLDIDMECLRPIDALAEGLDFFGTEIKPGRVTNTVIGAAPEHPVLARALAGLKPHAPGARFDKRLSGPIFLDSVVRQYPDMRTYPRQYFYPATAEEREEAFAVHHAARTWKDEQDWKEVTLRLERRLAAALRELEEERRAHSKTKRQLAAIREKGFVPHEARTGN